VALLTLSDGVAHAWLHAVRGAEAPGVGTLVERLRSGAWGESQVAQHLRQRFWSEMPDDDCRVAFVVVRAVGP